MKEWSPIPRVSAAHRIPHEFCSCELVLDDAGDGRVGISQSAASSGSARRRAAMLANTSCNDGAGGAVAVAG